MRREVQGGWGGDINYRDGDDVGGLEGFWDNTR
jgi:hypothetical protein